VSTLEAAVFAPILALTLWLGVAPAANLSAFERDAARAAQVVALGTVDAPSLLSAADPPATQLAVAPRGER
jgi:hypothetical protein